jgi:hypothetical protein
VLPLPAFKEPSPDFSTRFAAVQIEYASGPAYVVCAESACLQCALDEVAQLNVLRTAEWLTALRVHRPNVDLLI